MPLVDEGPGRAGGAVARGKSDGAALFVFSMVEDSWSRWVEGWCWKARGLEVRAVPAVRLFDEGLGRAGGAVARG